MANYSEISYLTKLISISLGVPCQIIENLKEYLGSTQPKRLHNDDDSFDAVTNDMILESILFTTHQHAKFQTMDKIISAVNTHYIVLYLTENLNSIAVVGPYLIQTVNTDMIYTAQKVFNMPKSKESSMRRYFYSLKVVAEETILSIIYVARSHIFKEMLSESTSESLQLVRDFDFRGKSIDIWQDESKGSIEMYHSEWTMQIRQRLLIEVQKGLFRTSNGYLSQLLNKKADDVTNKPWTKQTLKLSCAAYNAIFREAALQNKRIPPVKVDTVYFHWMERLEAEMAIEELQRIPSEMLGTYCVVVRRYMLKNFSPLTNKACNYIQINLSKPMKIQEIADVIGKSTSYLAQLFRTEVGMSVITYINRERVKEARFLMETTTLPVQEVGNHVGIPDAGFFTRIFKKYEGLTPTEYRRSFSQKNE